MHKQAQVYKCMGKEAHIYTNNHQHTSKCTKMQKNAQICADLHKHPKAFTSTIWHAQKIT
jgi:hypothetical protein